MMLGNKLQPRLGRVRQVRLAAPHHGELPLRARLLQQRLVNRGARLQGSDHARQERDAETRADQIDDEIDLAAAGDDGVSARIHQPGVCRNGVSG